MNARRIHINSRNRHSFRRPIGKPNRGIRQIPESAKRVFTTSNPQVRHPSLLNDSRSTLQVHLRQYSLLLEYGSKLPFWSQRHLPSSDLIGRYRHPLLFEHCHSKNNANSLMQPPPVEKGHHGIGFASMRQDYATYKSPYGPRYANSPEVRYCQELGDEFVL